MSAVRLLVIDDDPNIRKLLTELLSGRPEFRLLVAGDGKEAVRLFVQERIDVVLTDIHMPGFTGLELVADMQKVKFKPEILVMTANATPENVEKARQIGARSVIIKPFDDLSIVEAEIEKAVKAVRASGRGNGNSAVAAPAPAASPKPAPPAAATTAAATTSAAPAASAPRVRQPLPVSDLPAPPAATAKAVPGLDSWKDELTRNDTPPAAVRAAPEPAAPAPARPAAPSPAPPTPAPQARAVRAPAVPEPPPAPAPAPPADAGTGLDEDLNFDELKEIASAPLPEPAAAPPPSRADQVPPLPPEMEDIFRVEASLDIGRMKMQVPIVCLQTWEEKAAVKALRRLAAETQRELCTWSAAKGLLKDDEQPMGEMYRDPARALEFIRRQKNRGIYVLADFRQCLEDRTVVRLLREMVMDLATAHTALVITSPRLVMPPELGQLCVSFDWPQGDTDEPETLLQEVESEVAAATGRSIQMDASARMQLLDRVREMPAARARFEIARVLMARAKTGR